MELNEFQKSNIRKEINKGLKYNCNYLQEQAQAYDTEYSMQKTFSIQIFPEEKLDLVRALRDYLYELIDLNSEDHE